MTREEAIYELQLCVDAWDKWMLPGCSSLDKHKEAIKMALADLRGPTREQVKKAWRGEWKVIGADKRGRHGIPYCMRCEKCNPYKSEFCPHCGSPMTDEAVDIVMERLEEMRNG